MGNEEEWRGVYLCCDRKEEKAFEAWREAHGKTCGVMLEPGEPCKSDPLGDGGWLPSQAHVELYPGPSGNGVFAVCDKCGARGDITNVDNL